MCIRDSAEGAVYVDFLAQDESGAETVLRAHSLLWVQNHVAVSYTHLDVYKRQVLPV